MLYSGALGERTAVGTKAHALYGQLLNDNTVWELLHAEGLAEIAARLHDTDGYRPYLENILTRDIRRRHLEPAIRTIPLDEAARFLGYMTGKRKALIKAWLDRYEISNLKGIIRWQLSGRQNRDMLRSRILDIPGSSVPYEVLMSSRDMTELLDALRESRYYNIIKDPIEQLLKTGGRNPFSVEMALDIDVETQIFNRTNELDEADRAPLMPVVGGYIDLMNMYWVYRGRRYFDMVPGELMNRLLPCHYKVNLNTLKEMARATDNEVMYEYMRGTPYGRYLPESLPDDEAVMERSMRRCHYMRTKQAFRQGAPGFHTAICYLFLRELEIMDIITIIEDVRYDYDRRTAAVYLIRPLIPDSGGDARWQS